MTPTPNILAVMAEVEAAAEKATPRPWKAENLVLGDTGRRTRISPTAIYEFRFSAEITSDAVYATLAANHAPGIIALTRRLLEVAQAIPDDDQPWELAELYMKLRDDYPGLLGSHGERGGEKEGEDASH